MAYIRTSDISARLSHESPSRFPEIAGFAKRSTTVFLYVPCFPENRRVLNSLKQAKSSYAGAKMPTPFSKNQSAWRKQRVMRFGLLSRWGHSPYADPALVSSLLAVHLPLYPELRFRIESMFALDLAHGVLSTELDLALIAEPSASPLLTLVELSSAPLCAVLSVDHPATSKQSVSIEDFGDVGWMLFPRKAHPIIYDRVMDVARSAGVSLVELHHYVSPQQVVQLIEENFDHVVPRGTR